MANGVCLASGCELSMRRWVRDPLDGAQAEFERYEEERVAKPNGAVRCSVAGCPTPHVPRPVGVTLRSVRKTLRAAGWRYVPGGPGRDLCPKHARADTEEPTDA